MSSGDVILGIFQQVYGQFMPSRTGVSPVRDGMNCPYGESSLGKFKAEKTGLRTGATSETTRCLDSTNLVSENEILRFAQDDIRRDYP